MFGTFHKEVNHVKQLLNRIHEQFLHQFPHITHEERKQMDKHIETLLTLDGYKFQYDKNWGHPYNKGKRHSNPIFIFKGDSTTFIDYINFDTYMNNDINHDKIAKDLKKTLIRIFTLNPFSFKLSTKIHTDPNIKKITYGLKWDDFKIGIQSALSKEERIELASNPILDAYISYVYRECPQLLRLVSHDTKDARCSRLKEYYQQSQYKNNLEFNISKCEMKLYKFTKEQEKEIFQ